MKKIITALLFATCTLLATSQSDFWTNFKAGATFGNNQSILKPEPGSDETVNNANGLSIGAQFLYKISELLTIESGVLRTNFNFETSTVYQTADKVFRNRKEVALTYLNIPLQTRWFIKNDRLDIFAITGLNNMILTKDIQKTIDYLGYQYTFETTDYNPKRFTTGVSLGAGINYNLSYRASFGLSTTYTIWSKNRISNMSSVGSLSILPTLYYQF